MDNNLVSIIMPCYNTVETVAESIYSVLQQSYTDWELIVVDDGSTDKTSEIISSFTDDRIQHFRNNTNLGVAFSRNLAIKYAQGRYIAFIDSDDLWMNNKLDLQVALLQIDNNAIACHTSYERINQNGNSLGYVIAKPIITFEHMLKSNSIANLTGMIDRRKVAFFFQKEVKHEDYLMWLTILRQIEGNYSIGIKNILAKYRVRSNSVSSNKIHSSIWHWNILRKELKLGYLSSCYYFCHYAVSAIRKRLI